jgi:hypothetical protein
MKDEEFVKKLENIELPYVEIESHRKGLKAVLMASAYPRENRYKKLFRGVKETMLKGLRTPQPLWKSLLLGAIAVAVIAGLLWSMQSLPGQQNNTVLAADTLIFSPEFNKTYNANYDYENYDIIEFTFEGEVLAGVSKNNGGNRTLTVELEEGKLSLLEIESMGEVFRDESDRQRSIDIAAADAGVKEMILQGAIIKKAMMQLTPLSAKTDEDSTPLLYRATKNRALVLLERGDEHWTVNVDMLKGAVIEINMLAR